MQRSFVFIFGVLIWDLDLNRRQEACIGKRSWLRCGFSCVCPRYPGCSLVSLTRWDTVWYFNMCMPRWQAFFVLSLSFFSFPRMSFSLCLLFHPFFFQLPPWTKQLYCSALPPAWCSTSLQTRDERRMQRLEGCTGPLGTGVSGVGGMPCFFYSCWNPNSSPPDSLTAEPSLQPHLGFYLIWFLLRWGFLTGLDLTYQARVASQPVLMSCLFLVLLHWDFNVYQHPSFFLFP